jgi:hypothetical protein
MTTYPTESSHPTRRLPTSAGSATCKGCKARVSKLALYRVAGGLACHTCMRSAA